jgi:nucleotide-binding universal stress UspA family protein
VNAAVEQLRGAVERLLREGRTEGIEPGGPLGAWLEAQAEVLDGLASVLDGQTQRFEDVLAGIQAANQTELAKLATALEAAREAVRQGDQAVKQARNAQLAATVQQEAVVQRMIEETLPKFAEALKGALVVREARWNRRQAWTRYALAVITALSIVGTGYGLRAWADQDRLAAYDRCLAAPIAAAGHLYCALD